MRKSLLDLFNQSVVIRYTLPHDTLGGQIPCAKISTCGDQCLCQIADNEKIAGLIYNGVVEYAYNDYEIDITKLNALQRRALQSKLKFNPDAPLTNQLAYGFQGEVMLHLVLDYFYNAQKSIARGYLYCPLENGETKGYDSYLMVEGDDSTLYLLFGEAKFYIDGYKRGVKKVFENIDKALSDDYLNRNFIAMDNQYEHLNPQSRLPAIIDQWRDNPDIVNMAQEAVKYNMHLVYPILIVFDDKANSYDNLIFEVVNHINTNHGSVNVTLTVPHTLFFIFFPVGDSRAIKTQVIQWISQQQPVMP